MKNTKRFLALILALILATSGILSGIPGGGVARAEESSGKDISASLSQDMADWDIGAEIVGDETVAGEPWVEDSSSSAVVEEEAEDSSTIIDEESEDGDEETLTNTVFGEYDPATAAEAEFKGNAIPSDQENENVGEVILQDENKAVSENSDEKEDSDNEGLNETNDLENKLENDSEDLTTFSGSIVEEEFADEEDYETVSIDRVAGAGKYFVVFTKETVLNKNHDVGGWASATTFYVYSWGSSGGTWQKMTKYDNSGGGRYYANIGDDRNFLFATVKDTPTNDQKTRNMTNVADSENRRVYRISNYQQNSGVNPSGPFYLEPVNQLSASELPDDGGGSSTIEHLPDNYFQDKLVIYFDASLSALVKSKETYSGGNYSGVDGDYLWRTIPYQTYNAADASSNPGGVATRHDVWLIQGSNYVKGELLSSDSNQAKDLMTVTGRSYADAGAGTLVYRFLVDKNTFITSNTTNDTTFYFARSGWQNKGPSEDASMGNTGPWRTELLKLPANETVQSVTLTDDQDSNNIKTYTTSTISHSCFFADGGDPCAYNGSNRAGYWDEVAGPRDPEKRSYVNNHYTTTNYYNTIGTNGIDAIVDAADIGTALKPTSGPIAAGSEVVISYVDATLYDYYSDWELSGQNRDNNISSNSPAGPSESTGTFRTMYPFMSLNKALSAEYGGYDGNR